ncbi:ubiquitinyl hydrolase [Fragilaria crotonensis]|nr:ubiquitinyl hydrolase [Fragilaria crotonensis]
MSTAVLSPRLDPISTIPKLGMDEDEDFVFVENDGKSLADDSSVPSLADDIVMEDVEDDIPTALGGLVNLGNTCYLNSATQMLASLDHFLSALEEASPRSQDEAKLRLRLEFLSLMETLRSGETVRPDAFKKAVDERSPLFVGFRQQDAHEFLTTLLDLLDEVYQGTTDSNGSSSVDEDAISRVADGDDTKHPSKEGQQKNEESSTRPQTGGIHNDSNSGEGDDGWLSRLPSFCDLKVDEISMLLYGDDEKHENTSESLKPRTHRPTEEQHPQCKLIGGRAVVPGVSSPLQVQDDSGDASSASTESSSPARPQAVTNSSPIEKYLHLSIDVGSSEGTSVEEGLRKFFSPEKRELKCEKCFCESATQTTEITKLPPALLFHFKRFIVDISPDYSSVTYRKNQSAVEFPSSLSLDVRSVLGEFVADDVTIPAQATQASCYQIRSICNHIGSSASCGHYTADANRLYGMGERAWTRFNDDNVSRLDSAMGAATTAYMVLYELG